MNNADQISCSIYKCHDDAKDKDFELELSWICPESGGKHQYVPADIVAVRMVQRAAMLDLLLTLLVRF